MRKAMTFRRSRRSFTTSSPAKKPICAFSRTKAAVNIAWKATASSFTNGSSIGWPNGWLLAKLQLGEVDGGAQLAVGLQPIDGIHVVLQSRQLAFVVRL